MYDNGRRLLADRWTCTFIGLNDVLRQTSFRQHGYRTPIGRLRLGVNARTETSHECKPGLSLTPIEK